MNPYCEYRCYVGQIGYSESELITTVKAGCVIEAAEKYRDTFEKAVRGPLHLTVQSADHPQSIHHFVIEPPGKPVVTAAPEFSYDK